MIVLCCAGGRIRKYEALCFVVGRARGLGEVVNVFLIKRNDPDFKKVNIFPHMQWWGGRPKLLKPQGLSATYLPKGVYSPPQSTHTHTNKCSDPVCIKRWRKKKRAK